jgi:ABC-type branched-subunit amino acid transport system ATPase component
LLELIEISKTFGEVVALRQVSFRVERKLITALIGPYGAGKTTLLNVITGIYPASKGEILLEGQDISRIRPHKATYLGIARTFQEPRIFHDMSVMESVLLGFYPGPYAEYIAFHKKRLGLRLAQKEILDKVMGVLDLLHMTERKDQPYASLRHGDRKRLELARALINDPKLVLLDEPVAGLGISETWRIADVILKLKESGTTVLLVEHDIDWVMQISDMIVVLSQGKKVAQGTPIEIKDEELADAYLA